MSGADWQAGDLALCVRGGPIKCPNERFGRHRGNTSPRKGEFVTVTGVAAARMDNGEYCGCLTLMLSDGRHGLVTRFRKIRPHTPDAEDIETIRLYRSNKVEVPA